MHKEFTILQDIVVHSVPDGVRTTLEKGKTGIISQSLGDNYTIVVEGNMYQVSGVDGEKIGEEKRDISSNNFASEEEIWNVLHTCYDPEIPVNIVDLGLVYNCEIKEQDSGVNILIQMTLTAPGCGMGPVIADEVKQKRQVDISWQAKKVLTFRSPPPPAQFCLPCPLLTSVRIKLQSRARNMQTLL